MARTAVVVVLDRVPVVRVIVSTASVSVLPACLVRRVDCHALPVCGARTVSRRAVVISRDPPAATLGSDLFSQ